jgi:large subunit ribosomal protein L13
MIIDAKDKILGRVASYAAKNAMIGESINIINCELAVVSGNRSATLDRYMTRVHRGSIRTGPFCYRRPDMFVKRTIRGMISYNKDCGKKAFKRIKCYIGVPDVFKGQKVQQLDDIDVSKLNIVKFVKVKEICQIMGSK